MCAKDKRTNIEKKQLGKKSEKSDGGLATTDPTPTDPPPPPPTAVSPRVEI